MLMAISDLISHSPPTASLSTRTRWGFAACFKIWTQYSLGQKIKHLKVNPTQAGKLQHTDFPCLRSSNRPWEPGSRTQSSWVTSQLPFAVYPVKPCSVSMNPSCWEWMWDEWYSCIAWAVSHMALPGLFRLQAWQADCQRLAVLSNQFKTLSVSWKTI